MGWLDPDELRQVLPAETSAFPSPIPTQSVSSDEFMPAPQTAPDRRFAGDAWQGDPRFATLAHTYLAQAQMLDQALLASPMDERTRAQWRFVLRQVVDAASPANCLATNPEVMQQALDSGGMSLAAGLQLFMRDLAKGRLSMTDEAAFETA